MARFKVGDKVRLVRSSGFSFTKIGDVGVITQVPEMDGRCYKAFFGDNGGVKDRCYWNFGENELELVSPASDDLKITKEAVLRAAGKCGTAKDVLKELFPTVFENPPEEWREITTEVVPKLRQHGTIEIWDRDTFVYHVTGEMEQVFSHGYKIQFDPVRPPSVKVFKKVKH